MKLIRNIVGGLFALTGLIFWLISFFYIFDSGTGWGTTIAMFVMGLIILAVGGVILPDTPESKSTGAKNGKRQRKSQVAAAPTGKLPEGSSFKGASKQKKVTTDGLTYTLKKGVIQSLIALSDEILEDDKVSPEEIQQLKSWLERYPAAENDHRTSLIHHLVSLEDEAVDAEELKLVLSEFCDQQQEEWEQQKEKTLSAERKKAERELELSRRPPEPVVSEAESLFIDEGDEAMITYEDARGSITKRIITIRSVTEKNGHIYLDAVCQSVGHYRTFRADRIHDMTMLDTGEYIPDAEAALS